MLIIYLWRERGEEREEGEMSSFTPPVSAAQAGLLGCSPEDVQHSPWLLHLFGTQFQRRGAGFHGGAAGWARQGWS